MSFATRCTSCGTIFRVVQDQLKVSEGWVRCGRCDEVFNALHGLFDLEHESPPEWERAPRTDGGESSTGAASNGSDNSDGNGNGNPRDLSNPALAPAPDAEVADIHVASHAQAASEQVDFTLENRPVDVAPPVEISTNGPGNVAEEESKQHAVLAAIPAIDQPMRAEPTPEFVQQTQRQARWQSRPVIATLWAVTLVLVLLLAMQVLYHFRDLAVSRWPNLKPGLTSLCAALDCVIAAPRRIDNVAVENSALTRGAAPDSLRLALTLRNRGPYPVAVPSIDLSLTNMGGQLIARRTLSPRDLRVTTPQLEPGAELSLQSLLSTGNSPVAGYTVEIFYP